MSDTSAQSYPLRIEVCDKEGNLITEVTVEVVAGVIPQTIMVDRHRADYNRKWGVYISNAPCRSDL